jgi:hypothetical protein
MLNTLLNIKAWLNNTARWHDLAHVLFGYFLTSFIGDLSGIWYLGGIVTLVYILIKEFLVDKYVGLDNWTDIGHYLIGIGLGVLPLLI